MNGLYQIPVIILAVPFFILLVLFYWLGHKFKKFQTNKNPDINSSGLGPAESSLLGLTALLLSFAFGISASKFDTRRQIIVEESNDIGTTILRCDLYPDSIRNAFRADLKDYLEERIQYYEVGDDQEKIKKAFDDGNNISAKCWHRAARLSHNLDNRVATAQMIPALNAMIDITTTREASRKALVPRLIMDILPIMIIISAFLLGYGSKSEERNWVVILAFSLMSTLTLYLVFELDRPRKGFINLDSSQKYITELRSNFIEK